jgi:hypothetical protein
MAQFRFYLADAAVGVVSSARTAAEKGTNINIVILDTR